MANKIIQGRIRNISSLKTTLAKYISIRKTIKVRSRLNNSLSVSDNGKKYAGILSDFNNPAEPTILPTACPVTFEKKNQSINPEETYNV